MASASLEGAATHNGSEAGPADVVSSGEDAVAPGTLESKCLGPLASTDSHDSATTGLETRSVSSDWRGVGLLDLVQLAPGEVGCDVLRPGEVGQVVMDNRHGSNPFQVLGPRGTKVWFRGECLVVCTRRHRVLSNKSRSGPVPQQPLMQQVVEALRPNVNLDFPKITDICEAAARSPASADVAMSVLVATLGEQVLKPGDSRSIAQDYLKVLTIFNEMLYDSQVVEIMRRTPGLKPALERLQGFHQQGEDAATDENIRMLAHEVGRRVFSATGRAGRATPRTEIIAFCPERHLLVWLPELRGIHIHARHCAACQRNLPRMVERYTCQTCYYYNLCVSCVRWGAPRRTEREEPLPASAHRRDLNQRRSNS
mmetsp:Transcript_29437/g.80501  ORF Transcript_29437/g.80501 Transcript_29437/m.80501 type:complete len:369 (-) Transcript_29437:30-1136(-)